MRVYPKTCEYWYLVHSLQARLFFKVTCPALERNEELHTQYPNGECHQEIVQEAWNILVGYIANSLGRNCMDSPHSSDKVIVSSSLSPNWGPCRSLRCCGEITCRFINEDKFFQEKILCYENLDVLDWLVLPTLWNCSMTLLMVSLLDNMNPFPVLNSVLVMGHG